VNVYIEQEIFKITIDLLSFIVYISHMYNSHNSTLIKKIVYLEKFFDEPASSRQKQYELVRAVVKEKMSTEDAAEKFGYKTSTAYTIVRDSKAGKLELFPVIKKGPKKRRTSSDIQEKIIEYRKNNLSITDIDQRLKLEDISISVRTIERILKDAGYEKLKRRTHEERGITRKNKIIPKRSEHLNFLELELFNVDCPVSGVFFFLPYIIEAGIIEIVKKCKLPESNSIESVQASLSMLLLKLIGNERLSHMDAYDHEPGLGVFAGLTRLPKNTYMCTYSCRTSETMLLDFQEEIIKQFRTIYPQMYTGNFINLDFHSIPHFGDKSEMENIWCGSRNKTLKGANTVFAQDGQSNAILYTRADILRREESKEVKKFISYWKKINGDVNETLVFDCKFTKYQVLDELTADGIKFITLRKRNKTLIEETLKIPKEEWKKINLPIPKRKHKRVSVYETETTLSGCSIPLRQIIVKDHGRQKPTYIVTNNRDLLLLEMLVVYAKRWHIEIKLDEMVSFFNLNALSSPLMIRIHFDVLWTMIADTLYRRFAQDLRRFEKHQAPSIFKKFINMPGRVVYDGKKFTIKIRKRAYTPVLLGVEKLTKPFKVPWLDGKTVEIMWTP